jgi:MAPEG family
LPSSRGLSLLLGACGVVAAGLLWRQLAAGIAAPSDGVNLAGRVGLALAWLLPALLVLWAMLLAQMGARFLGGVFDPLAGKDGRFLAVNQRIITNTVEHASVFVPALLALAAGVDREHMPLVLALPLVFAAGRVAFWAGYLVAPLGRGIGMAATVAATAGALGGAVAVWCFAG